MASMVKHGREWNRRIAEEPRRLKEGSEVYILPFSADPGWRNHITQVCRSRLKDRASRSGSFNQCRASWKSADPKPCRPERPEASAAKLLRVATFLFCMRCSISYITSLVA